MYRRLIAGSHAITGLLEGPRLHFVPSEDHPPEMPRIPDPRRSAVVGLVVTLLLVLGGVLLVHRLGRISRLQDCVMSGRTNCAPIDPAAGSAR